MHTRIDYVKLNTWVHFMVYCVHYFEAKWILRTKSMHVLCKSIYGGLGIGVGMGFVFDFLEDNTPNTISYRTATSVCGKRWAIRAIHQ